MGVKYMKELYCEKYFNNTIKPKHLSQFEAKTPKGNTIKGYISRKPNKFLGSLVITDVCEKNGKSYGTEQFVQSFPKIHYWDKRYQLKSDDESVIYHCQEKLDGTCLIIYALKDDSGKIIELVPKTRGKAVADAHVLEMFSLVDKKAIEVFFKKEEHVNDTLMFELFGVLNKHDIAYMDTHIDIRLIGAYIGEEFLNYISISSYLDLDDFQKPDTVLTIEKYPGENSFSLSWCGRSYRLRNYEVDCSGEFPTLYDAVQEVKLHLEQINNDYVKQNGRKFIEGVVINGISPYDTQMYIKIKPKNIEIEAKDMDHVPRRFIVKEVQKYFDEYGSKVGEIYEKDETHYMKYVKRQLREEFTYEQIEDPRSIRRIKNTFMDVWNSKLPPMSLQNVCEELMSENHDLSVQELLKLFAKKYPSRKKDSRHVYNILTAMAKKQ